MDRELICNVYPWEWRYAMPSGEDGPFVPGEDSQAEGKPTKTQVANMLTAIQDAGFTAIAINETLSSWKGAGVNWEFHCLQRLWDTETHTLSTDTIQSLIAATPLKVLLRVWPYIPDALVGPLGEAFGPEVIGPRRENAYSLNAYAPESVQVMTSMASALNATDIIEQVDWITVGWDDSGEIDDIRQFILPYDEMTLTKASKGVMPVADRESTSLTRASGSDRITRFDDATAAMNNLLWAFRQALFAGKPESGLRPFGGMRGSCWHSQHVRRNLPFFDYETYLQTNDVNQLSDGACSKFGGPPVEPQHKALAFACDILRGSGREHCVVEFDTMNVNLKSMISDNNPNHPGVAPKTIYSRAISEISRESQAKLRVRKGHGAKQGDSVWLGGLGGEYAQMQGERSVVAVTSLSESEDQVTINYDTSAFTTGYNSSSPGLLYANWHADWQSALQLDAIERAKIAYDRGVSLMFTHFPYSYIVGSDFDPPGFYWKSTVSTIASLRSVADTMEFTVVSDQENGQFVYPQSFMESAILAWQGAGGDVDASVPISFTFNLT